MSRKHSVTLSWVLMTTVLLVVGCDDNKDSGARTPELDDPEFRQGSKAARAAAVLNGYCANNATHDRSFNNATQPKP
jgi:hypothetical protein